MSDRDCNYCVFKRIQKKARKKGKHLLKLHSGGWINIYTIGDPPVPGQGEPKQYNGQPIQFQSGFMELPERCCC